MPPIGPETDRAPSETLPGQPAHIPIEPRPSTIVLGALFLGWGAWLAFHWIPKHRPLEVGDLAVTKLSGLRVFLQPRLSPEDYWSAVGSSLILMAIGLAGLIAGFTWRNYAEVVCRRCRQRVVARKTTFGLRCPVGNYEHHAKFRTSMIVLGVLLLVLLVPLGLALLLSALRGGG